MTQFGYTVPQAVTAVKGSVDYAQARYIEVIASIPVTGAAGNATVMIEVLNQEN